MSNIPKIIHQTYKNYHLPNIYQYCQKSIKELHPEFEYRFYTDDDMYNIIKNEFKEYFDAFDKLPRMIMKIDMFRYFLMYKYGGLYADMDYLMIKKFNLLNYDVVIPCNRENDKNEPICLGNCIFASKPNHPFWKLLIDTLFHIDREKINYTNDKNIDSNEHGTGPIFVYTMWKKYNQLYHDNTIFIPQRELFHPITKIDNNYINNLKEKNCYGMHICTGLWRNNKL
jgi:mannosyltransferase OCH1-like enzyme